MVGGNHTANAVGSLFVLQRHIARRPTPGNAKHVGGARRRSLFGGALVCIVCAGRDAVPLSVRQSRVKSGQVRAKSGSTTTTTLLLLLYLPTYILDISPTGYQSYCAALYAIRADWPGHCCQNRVPCAGTLKLIRQPTTLVR